MHRFLLWTFLFLFSAETFQAQTTRDIGKIVLGVKILPSASAETHALGDYLSDKIGQIATRAGYSSYGDCYFFIAPDIIVEHVEMAEGGMKNIYIVSGVLSLSIQERDNGTIFSSIVLPFKGSASKKETAIRNAITGIDYHAVSKLLDAAKAKILSYYEAQADAIFTRADSYVQNKKYDDAIACLMTIPEELSDLYKEALTIANRIYEIRDTEIREQELDARHNRNAEILSHARSLLAMHNPTEALKILWNYQSGDDAQDTLYYSMTSEAETQISEGEKRAMEKERQAYEDRKRQEDCEWAIRENSTAHRMAVEKQRMEQEHAESIQELQLEQQRIDAIKSIACEYLRTHNQSNHNTY